MENIEFAGFNLIVNDIRLILLEHGHLHTGKEWVFMNLSSPFNRLYYVIDGHAYIKNEAGEVHLSAGNAYLVPLNNPSDYICDDHLHMFYIHFRLELVPGHDVFDGRKVCKSIPVETASILQLIEDAKSNRIGHAVACKGLLMQSIGALVSAYDTEIDEQMQLVHNYIELYSHIKANCYADLRVSSIARHLNMPLTNLSKNFKRDTGLTLKKFIDAQIVQKAQELLLTTDLPIRNISYELHFLDEFHFSRFFKNKTGFSPNKYRQRSNTFK